MGVICRPVQRLHSLELSSATDLKSRDSPCDTLKLTDISPVYVKDSSNAHSTTIQALLYLSRTEWTVKPPDK